MKFLIFLVLVWTVAATSCLESLRPGEELFVSCSEASGAMRVEFRPQCPESGRENAIGWRIALSTALDGGLAIEWVLQPNSEPCRRV